LRAGSGIPRAVRANTSGIDSRDTFATLIRTGAAIVGLSSIGFALWMLVSMHRAR
jgi:hypothetical protein